jgi:hypothetical protein
MLSLPAAYLSVELWLSLVLARTYGLIVLPDVEIAPALSAYGWHSPAQAWRVEGFRCSMVSSAIPSPQAWLIDHA